MSKARELAQKPSQPTGRKNLIINGAMQVAQRGTSFSHNGNINAYPVDRFIMTVYNTGFSTPTGGTSAQVDLTDLDSESLGFLTAIRFTPASDSKLCYLEQRVEDVSRLAGRTVTLSYYARVNTGTFTIPNDGRISQNFGSGGSSATNTFASFDDNILTTSWKRISYSLTLPSVVGKTINAGNNTQVRAFHTADLSGLGWIEITGVQLEVGAVATEFEHRSFGEELALCQRYYRVSKANSPYDYILAAGQFETTTILQVAYDFRGMRIAPTVTSSGGLAGEAGGGGLTLSGAGLAGSSFCRITINATTASTAGKITNIRDSGSGNAVVNFDAEL